MSMQKLLKTWSLPDRTQDRQQITLRLNYDLYAKLHALKSVYKTRTVNDMINDILETGLDEIIQALPRIELSQYEAVQQGFIGQDGEAMEGVIVGAGVDFDWEYKRILEEKSSDETQGEAA